MQPPFFFSFHCTVTNCNATRSESFCLKRERLQYEIHMNVSRPPPSFHLKKYKTLLINCENRHHLCLFPVGGGGALGSGYSPLLSSLLLSSSSPLFFLSSPLPRLKLKQSIRILALIIERETAGYSARAFLMWGVLKRCMDASPEGDGRASWSQGSVHLKIMCASAKARWPEKCSEDHYSPQSGLRDGHRADKILSIFMPLNQLYPHVLQMQIIWQAKHFREWLCRLQ